MKRFLLASTFTLLFISSLLCQQSSDLLTKADYYFLNKNFSKAEEIYDKAFSTYREDNTFISLVNYLEILDSKSKFEKLANVLGKQSNYFPDEFAPVFELWKAYSLYHIGSIEPSLASLTEVHDKIGKKYHNIQSVVILAEAGQLFAKGKYTESAELLSNNKNIGKTGMQLYYLALSGLSNFMAGDYNQAVKYLNRYFLYSDNADNNLLSYYIGMAYFHQKNYPFAKYYFLKVLASYNLKDFIISNYIDENYSAIYLDLMENETFYIDDIFYYLGWIYKNEGDMEPVRKLHGFLNSHLKYPFFDLSKINPNISVVENEFMLQNLVGAVFYDFELNWNNYYYYIAYGSDYDIESIKNIYADKVDYYRKLCNMRLAGENNIDYDGSECFINYLYGRFYLSDKEKAAEYFRRIECSNKQIYQDISLFYQGYAMYFYDKDNSIKKFEELIPDDNQFYPIGQFYLGNAYLEKGRDSLAVKTFLGLLSYDVSLKYYPYIYKGLGNAYFNIGEFDLSVAYFDKAQYYSSDEKFIDAVRYKKELSYWRLGHYKSSIDINKAFIKKYPGSKLNSLLQYQIGLYYFNKELYQEAIASFKELIAQDVGTSWRDKANLMIGKAFLELREFNDAISYFEMIVDQSGNSSLKSKSLFNLGKIYLIINEHEKSINYFNETIELLLSTKSMDKQLFYEVKTELGKIYFDLKFYKEAAFIFDAIPLEFKSPSAIFLQIKTYVTSGNYAKCIEFINSVKETGRFEEKTEGYTKDIRFLSALAHRELGEYETSIIELDDLMESDSTDAKLAGEVLYNKGVIYELQNDKPKALEAYQILITNYERSEFYFKALEKYNLLK